MGSLDWVSMLRFLPGIIIGLTVHEFAHAAMAVRLGDPSPKEDGRFSLNPLRHIDIAGLAVLMIAGFGWAKPVRIDSARMGRPVRDGILTALAGPFSNLALAIALRALAWAALAIEAGARRGGSGETFMLEVALVLLSGCYVNLGLFVFNLIPVPPLDGSHLYLWKLRSWDEDKALRIYKAGSLGLLVIIIAQNRIGVDILPIGPAVLGLFKAISSLFPL
jgi:Zn-dependent protease